MNEILNFQSITVYRVALPLKFDFKTAKGLVRVRETIIIRIEDVDGYIGYGECVAFTDPFYTSETVERSWNKLVEDYIFNLRAMRPYPLEKYMRQLQVWLKRDAMPMTIAGLENALLHLDCSRKSVNSIAHIMKTDLEDCIPMGGVIGDIPIDDVLPAVRRFVEQGCHRIKLKVTPIDGYERTKLVRDVYPHINLAVDANQSYSYDQLHDVARYNGLGLKCIEEPFAMNDLREYKTWRALFAENWPITTPICLDESILSYDDLSYAIEHGLLDVANIKIGRLGGLMQTRAAINVCREHHIEYWVGSMVESSISKIMHVQLAALGDSYMAGDLSDSLRYFEKDLTAPFLSFVDGHMVVPKEPGLGVDVLEAHLAEYTVNKWIL